MRRARQSLWVPSGSSILVTVIREDVARVVGFAPLPTEDACSDAFIEDFGEAVVALPRPASDDEARALLDLLTRPDDSDYHGVLWPVLHFIETAPGWPLPDVWERQGPWIDRLRHRLGNAGIYPPNAC